MTEKESQQLKKRLIELAQKSYSRGIYTYTPFLSMAEQQIFWHVEKEIACAGYAFEGGAPDCERKMIRFGSAELLGYEEDYPIRALAVVPVQAEFAEELTHRDYLGALMNLGIRRELIGDIFPSKKECIFFCQDSIASYLTDNLCQIRHTRVRCSVTEATGRLQAPVAEHLSVSVASVRIDTVISKVYNIARSKSLELFKAGRIFVNGRLTENNSYTLKEQDVVTVRGLGRFTYTGIQGATRKGKERVTVDVYR